MTTEPAPAPPGWEDPDGPQHQLRYRDDHAWPIALRPASGVDLRTWSYTVPARRDSTIDSLLGLLPKTEYVERIIVAVDEFGVPVATSHTYVPVPLINPYLDDGAWRKSEIGQFAMPGMRVVVDTRNCTPRMPTPDEADAFGTPLECAMMEVSFGIIIGAPHALRAGLALRAPGNNVYIRLEQMPTFRLHDGTP